jgi:signal transduction histidine kinase
MTPRKAGFTLAAAGALAALSVWVPSLENHPLFVPPTTLVLVGQAAAMFLFVVAGVTIWNRRPDSIVGPSLAALGFAGFFIGLLYTEHTWTVAVFLNVLMTPLLVQAVLAHPVGRLDRIDRRIVRVAWVVMVAILVLAVTTDDPRPVPCEPSCPAPLTLIESLPGVADFADVAAAVMGMVLFVIVMARGYTRWARGSSAARRALTPVITTVGALALIGLWPLSLVLDAEDRFLGDLASFLVLPLVALVAVGFLIGDLRSRFSYGVVGGLVGELERGGRVGNLEGLMQERLRDPHLALGFWLPDEESYVGTEGSPFAATPADPDRIVTEITVNGAPLAVVAHDPAVDRELVQMVGSAAALAFQNEQLHTELLARLAEVRESRARIVAAGDQARRRVERDVHDGAQQRLVSLGVALRVIEDRAGDGLDTNTRTLLAAAREEAAAAVDELRDLTQGLHPVLLSDAGLGAAIRRLADRAPMVVDVDVPDVRLPMDIEVCAYFVVAEALTNAAKHADADAVEIRVAVEDDVVAVRVQDDGVGGASTNGGSGLRGLRDRVEAIGGTLTVADGSPRGTRLEASIPCA